MRSLKKLAVAFVAVATLTVFSASASAGQRYIVLMHKFELSADFPAKVAAAGGSVARTFPNLGIAIAISGDANFIDNMSGMEGVKSVGPEPVHTLPEMAAEVPSNHAPTANDLLFNIGLLWGIQRVHAPEAWSAGVTGSHDTVVSVIDTGVAWNHPDLAPNVVHVDCFASIPCNPYPSFSDHGTHVAGTVAAAFDNGLAVGVAPNIGIAGYNVFEPIAGCGVCAFTSSRWAAMLDTAAQGFDVINMSLGGTGLIGFGQSDGLATFLAADNRVANAVIDAGVAIVASAGNAALDLTGPIVHVPGDLPGVVNVGATGIQPAPRFPFPGAFDIRAFYSNFGAPLTLSGPGGDCGEISTCTASLPNWFEFLVLSTIVFLDPACAATASCPTGYGWKGGTSMATPHVSGVAGLIKDENRNLNARQVATRVKSTAENLGDRHEFGHGMVDARGAID